MYIWAVNKNLEIVADTEKRRSEWISHTARLNNGRVVTRYLKVNWKEEEDWEDQDEDG